MGRLHAGLVFGSEVSSEVSIALQAGRQAQTSVLAGTVPLGLPREGRRGRRSGLGRGLGLLQAGLCVCWRGVVQGETALTAVRTLRRLLFWKRTVLLAQVPVYRMPLTRIVCCQPHNPQELCNFDKPQHLRAPLHLCIPHRSGGRWRHSMRALTSLYPASPLSMVLPMLVFGA